MYYQESENFVSNEKDSSESITAIDHFLAARSGLFFTMPTLELHTDIDAYILEPYIEYYVTRLVLIKQERLKCDCGQHYRITASGTADCDICERKLAASSSQVVQGFFVVKEPTTDYQALVGSQSRFSGPVLAEVATALISAFSEEDFERLLLHRLDIRLDEIISGNVGLRQKVDAALDHLSKRDRIAELLRAARLANATNELIGAVVQRLAP